MDDVGLLFFIASHTTFQSHLRCWLVDSLAQLMAKVSISEDSLNKWPQDIVVSVLKKLAVRVHSRVYDEPSFLGEVKQYLED